MIGAFHSAGQKCTATSRVIVEQDIYEPFVAALKKAVSGIKLGSALEPTVYLGPVASASQHKTVMSYVNLAREQAQVIAEGPSQGEQEQAYASGSQTSRQIRMKTRATMGACQGRVCRQLVEAWVQDKNPEAHRDTEQLPSRPPIRPITFSQLAKGE